MGKYIKGHTVSEEVRRKIGLANTGKNIKISETRKKLFAEGTLVNPFEGKHHTEQSKEKMRLYRLGKNNPEWSKELKRRLREGEFIHPTLGKHHSDEAKNKIGLSHLGKKHTEEHNKKIRDNASKFWQGKKLYPETIEKIKDKRKNWVTPKNDTKIEIKIQNLLEQLKIGFFKHYYCNEIEHNYPCDIFIPVQRNRDRFIKQPIIIEADGDYYHGNPEFYDEEVLTNKIRLQKQRDIIRTKELQDKGFKVLRLWEHEIKIMNLEKFKEKIL